MPATHSPREFVARRHVTAKRGLANAQLIPIHALPRFGKYVTLTFALLYVAAYLVVAMSRIQYPFELEWVEGSSLIQVSRIVSGQKLYVSPTLEYVPLIYAPLYFYVSAAFTSIFGIGFLPLRLTSFLASLGCLVMVFQLVHRPTRSSFAGTIAAGLFAATFRVTGAWFDLARVDSLWVFLLLLAFYLLEEQATVAQIFSGVFFSLAFLTKQSTLVVLLPAALYCILVQGRRCIFFCGTWATLLAASITLLTSLSDGWFNYYVFYLPSRHTIALSVLPILRFAVEDIAEHISTACLIMIYSFAFSKPSVNRHSLFNLTLLVSMVGLSLFGRLNSGGYDNVLLPGYAAICVSLGLAINKISISVRALPRKQNLVIQVVLYMLCGLQFASLRYSISAQIPAHADENAGYQLVNMIHEAEGPVLVPFHPYLSFLAGKDTYAHDMGISELRGYWGGQELDPAIKIEADINTAIEKGTFALILLDSDAPPWQHIPLKYERHPMGLDGGVFKPVTGHPSRPEFLFTPGWHITGNLLLEENN